MDLLQKILEEGDLNYFLDSATSADSCAYAVHKLLPPPICYEFSRASHFFGVPQLDTCINGISGLWDIHGHKASGKTFLCRLLAKNSPTEVVYININGAECSSFEKIV